MDEKQPQQTSHIVTEGITGDGLDQVLVSIIIPMYMCEDYVEEVLGDLCGQDFKDLEIICVVDGSPDRTLARAEEYAKRDSRIHVVDRPHGGAGAARNYGLSLAKGKYVMFLDADDKYPSDYVGRMVKTIEENTADIVICQYTRQDSWTGDIANNCGFRTKLWPKDSIVNPAKMRYLLCTVSTAAHNKIYHRDFLISNNLIFSTTESINDVLFVLTSMVTAKKIVLIRDNLYLYRQNHNINSISSNRDKSWQDLITVFDEVFSWLKHHEKENYYLDSFCKKWYSIFHTYARYGASTDFQKGVANYLATHEPWKNMPDRKLYRMAGLGTEVPLVKKALLKLRLMRLRHDSTMYNNIKKAIVLRDGEIENINEIRRQLELNGRKHVNINNSIPRAAFWRFQDYTKRRIAAYRSTN